jgi:hypothetical protein
MKKRILLVIALSIPLLGFLGKNKVKRGNPPIILDSYAASKVQPGTTWRIFLHAKDNDGDMKDVMAMLLEPGNVISPVSFTRIKELRDRTEVEGYLHLNTPREASFLGKEFIIRVQVRDRELNLSNAVKLSLTFANVPKENIPEKWQNAANHRLGGVMIELEDLNDWRSVY